MRGMSFKVDNSSTLKASRTTILLASEGTTKSTANQPVRMATLMTVIMMKSFCAMQIKALVTVDQLKPLFWKIIVRATGHGA